MNQKEKKLVRCSTCGAKMKEHPCCESCGAIVGHGHEDETQVFRRHNICGWCVNRWRFLEGLHHREVIWEEMLGRKGSATSFRKDGKD